MDEKKKLSQKEIDNMARAQPDAKGSTALIESNKNNALTDEKPFAEEVRGVPKELMVKLGDNLFVRKAGLQLKAKQMGMRRLKSWIEETFKDDDGNVTGYLAKAELYVDIGSRDLEILRAAKELDKDVQKMIAQKVLDNTFEPAYTGEGTATNDNVDKAMKGVRNRMRETALTRAEARAMRNFTGSGFATNEEIVKTAMYNIVKEDEEKEKSEEEGEVIDVTPSTPDEDYY